MSVYLEVKCVPALSYSGLFCFLSGISTVGFCYFADTKERGKKKSFVPKRCKNYLQGEDRFCTSRHGYVCTHVIQELQRLRQGERLSPGV